MSYQAGDEDAIRELFERYKVRLVHFCHGMVGNRADAEDIAGEVFLAVVSRRNGYQPGHKFSTWIYTIAHHKCVDRLRRSKRLLLFGFGPGDAEPGSEDPLEVEALSPPEGPLQLKQEDIAARVRAALMQLPMEQRQAIMLRQYQECSYEQIAPIMRCSLAKVKMLIFHGKERLRSELASFVKEAI